MSVTKTLTSIGECCQCKKEHFEGQSIIYDCEGGVTFCDDNCLAIYISKHPREFIDLLIEHQLFEVTKLKK